MDNGIEDIEIFDQFTGQWITFEELPEEYQEELFEEYVRELEYNKSKKAIFFLQSAMSRGMDTRDTQN